MTDQELLQEMQTIPGEFIEEIKVLQKNREDWEYDGEFLTVEDARRYCASRLEWERRDPRQLAPMDRKIVRRIVFERVLEELPV